ncbi:MAG TPA: cbb3-type cytochrome oxidase assembly protein [Thermoanaerobaculia bacterium]|nr:cbb3-type cytochrome oxidase assembly protein [Thermoanaerobaculia bacterium]
MFDSAATSVFWLYTTMFLFGTGALLFLYWAVKSGAVANSEAPKYRMMEDDLPGPPSAALPEGGGTHGDVSR